MYASPNLFCCEPGYTASYKPGIGFCEPPGAIVPSNLLAPTVTQDTIAGSQPSTVVTSLSQTATTEMTATNMATTSTGTTTTGSIYTNMTNSIASSTSTFTSPAQSKGTSVTVITPTVANPAPVSASGSASTSGKSATSIGTSNNLAAMDVVIAVCFGVGLMALVG